MLGAWAVEDCIFSCLVSQSKQASGHLDFAAVHLNEAAALRTCLSA